MNKKVSATFALVLAGVIGGVVPIAVKIVLRELSQFTYLFFRFTLMFILLFSISRLSWSRIRVHVRHILLLGVLWVANPIVFTFGVERTTALASQLIYACVPVLIGFGEYIQGKKLPDTMQMIGVFCSIVGVGILMVPHNQAASFGTGFGNLLVFVAASLYAMYLLRVKTAPTDIGSKELTTMMAGIGSGLTGVMMLGVDSFVEIKQIFIMSSAATIAFLFMSVIAGFGMWYLLNWGTKHGSPLVAASMLYINILTAGLLGVLFLGELITKNTIIGGLLLLIGSFFVAVYPLIKRRT